MIVKDNAINADEGILHFCMYIKALHYHPLLLLLLFTIKNKPK